MSIMGDAIRVWRSKGRPMVKRWIADLKEHESIIRLLLQFIGIVGTIILVSLAIFNSIR